MQAFTQPHPHPLPSTLTPSIGLKIVLYTDYGKSQKGAEGGI